MAEETTLVSRRNILLGLAGGVAIAGGITLEQTGTAGDLAELLNPSGSGRRGVDLATAEKEDWALQVGTFFTSETGQALKLVNVKLFPQRGARPDGLRKSAFVAAFDIVSGGDVLPADMIHTVNHAEGGTFDMFLTAGNRVRPMRMLALFN